MDNVTKAKINLFAVLRNLQDLCKMDKEAAELIKDTKLTVGFNVPSVGNAVISFDHGNCEFKRGKGKAALQLYFTSAEHFNKLVDGEKTVPIFYNVFKVGFLLDTFTKLADRLSYYLQPKDDSLFENREFFEINTKLTAYTAFFALCEIANSDIIGRIIAKRLGDGNLLCGIPDVMQMTIKIQNHVLVAQQGACEEPHATMGFKDLEFAHDLLNGKTSSFAGMGSGGFQVFGRVDMLEQMSKLLTIVSQYLQ